MTGTRIARFVVVVVGAAGGRAMAEPCAPSVSVTGDRDAVQRVDAELRKLGDLVDTASAGCPAPVQAAVQLEGVGLAVAVSDAGHRSEGRVVGDEVVAAEWIDSWLHDSLDPWRTLAPPSSVAPGPAAATAVDPLRVKTGTAVAQGAQPSLLDRLSFEADYEQSWMSDGSSWQGADAAACVRVGFACLGARGRFAAQTIAAGMTEAARQDVVVLATASATLRAGAMRISPELGIGVGAFTTSRVDGCVPVPPNGQNEPNQPAAPVCPSSNPGPIYVGDHLSNTTVAPRAAIAVRVSLPLFGPVWLDGIASAAASPFAHTGTFATAAADVPPNILPSQVALPGEPVFAFQLGIGLRVETAR